MYVCTYECVYVVSYACTHVHIGMYLSAVLIATFQEYTDIQLFCIPDT